MFFHLFSSRPPVAVHSTQTPGDSHPPWSTLGDDINLTPHDLFY